MLEVIERGAVTESHPIPLLFVHGAWHGAWCWDEHFLGFFAERGYRAIAVSMRGHGASPAGRRVYRCSAADLVEDIRFVADELPTRPVVIGHSLGGYVVQKYLEDNRAPAGVLLASIPPAGIGGFLWRNAKRLPLHTLRTAVTAKSLHAYRTPELARAAFYSEYTPESDVVRYAARLDEEYTNMTILETTFLNLPRPERVTAPLLVLGARCDGCFTTEEIEATARAYRTDAEFFAKMGHNMMVEPGWQLVAERIDSWLTVTCPRAL